jgi:hypothetical protein
VVVLLLVEGLVGGGGGGGLVAVEIEVFVTRSSSHKAIQGNFFPRPASVST